MGKEDSKERRKFNAEEDGNVTRMFKKQAWKIYMQFLTMEYIAGLLFDI